MKMKHCIILGLAIIFSSFLFIPLVKGQNVADSTYQGSYFTDIRSDALGMNGVSLAYQPSNMYSNPASLTFLQNPSVITLNHLYDASKSIQLQNLTSIIFNNSTQALAIGLTYRKSGWGGIEKALNLYPKSSVPYRIKEFDLTLGYSVKLLHVISLGGLLQTNYGGINSKYKQTLSAGVGVLYSPSPAIRYGLVLRGIGRNISYTNLIPRKISLSGTSYQNSYGVTTIKRHSELSLGITMRYPYSLIENQPYLTITASNEKIFGEPGLWYNAGIEFNIIKNISLRGGYIYGPDFKGVTTGFGLSYGFFQIDYALSPNPHSTRQYQQLAISINLNEL